MVKLKQLDDALGCIKDGATLMVGGFLGCGTPENVMDWIVGKSIKSLTVIGNDTAMPGKGIGKLIDAGLVSTVVASHIGTNPLTQKLMNSGEMKVELVPQGTLAERIRAAGVGLGGVLTPTGLGTIVEDGKPVMEVDGKRFLLEKALKADVALIKAYKADKKGNLLFRKTARNFNPLMAMAAEYVVVEVEEYMEDSYIEPDAVHLPGLFIDAIVLSKNGKTCRGDA